ncbi:hypothetical protein E4T56_gene18100 [Termitomyces sp. T112]|nr:hypothetical protein E4T56_gene18100 [Termitomyces sp. T112]
MNKTKHLVQTSSFSCDVLIMVPFPPNHLLSTVETTFALCPQFRILVVGNGGVGKSSLIASIFNVNKEDIDISDHRPGIADINREYTSDDNPHFILHDSQGFEPGSADHWKTVQDFISQKCKSNLPVKDRLHAIWMCVEAPHGGLRLTQTADEALIRLSGHFNIPVIFVLTKCDLLFNECYSKAARRLEPGADTSDLRTKALKDTASILDATIKELQKQSDRILKILFWGPQLWKEHRQSDHIANRWIWRKPSQKGYVAVSTEKKFPDSLKTLTDLTIITRQCLRTTETLLPWAVAQRVDPKQKVLASIEEGFKKYWKDLGKSTAFQGHVLVDCLWCIHLDIIKVWNFRDPKKLLSANEFRLRMLELIRPLIPQCEADLSVNERFPVLEILGSIFDSIIPLASMAIEAASLTIVAISFLYSRYQAVPRFALCLEAYIVDLTLVLHELFVSTLNERQQPLNDELILAALERYKDTRSEHVHELVCLNIHSTLDALHTDKNKGNVGDLIRSQLGMDS